MSGLLLTQACGDPSLEISEDNLSGKWKSKSGGQITTWDLRPDGSMKVSTENPSGMIPIGSVMFTENSKRWNVKGESLHFDNKFGSSYKILKLTKTRMWLEADLIINNRKDKLVFYRVIVEKADE